MPNHIDVMEIIHNIGPIKFGEVCNVADIAISDGLRLENRLTFVLNTKGLYDLSPKERVAIFKFRLWVFENSNQQDGK